jgi:hypothetical protein
MSIFHTKADQARKSNVRLEVTRLEDRTVPSTLAGNFSDGVWRHTDAHGWQHLSTGNAAIVACASDGSVVAEFNNLGFFSGVWRFEDATGWQHISYAKASILDIAAGGHVVGEFQGSGVWRFEDATGWQHLTYADASLLSIDRYGTVLGEFSSGLWVDRNNNWILLTSAHASALEIAGNDYVVAEFQGVGVFRFEFTQGWLHLTSADATSVGINDYGTVVGNFSNGEWRYQDASGWRHLTYATKAKIVDAS